MVKQETDFYSHMRGPSLYYAPLLPPHHSQQPLRTGAGCFQHIEIGTLKHSLDLAQFLAYCFRNQGAGCAENLRNRFLFKRNCRSFAIRNWLAGLLASSLCA